MEILFIFIAFITEIVGTVAGFGSSTIVLPISLFFFDFNTALIVVAFLHLFGNIGRLSFFRYGLDKKILIRFGIPNIIFTIVGALLISYISQDILKGILGLFLIAYTLISWSKTFNFSQSNTAMFMGGGVSGFFAGLIGTGGALRGAFLTAFGLPKEKFIATKAAIALAVDLTRIPIYLSQSSLESKVSLFIFILFPVVIFGSYIGNIIVKKISQHHFRKIVLAAIFVIGLTLAYNWLF